MFTKESKLYSIFTSKCPQCHEGAFFENKFSFNVLKTTQTKSHCPKCNLKYMREPSFFYGAMYVGYGLSVALAVALYIISVVFLGLTMRESLFVIAIGLFALAPWSLRISRVIWIHLFIKYQKDESLRKK
ncbi:DUF983 domain-containing protein [Wenyingzhuangia sp. 2_MG-2023]|uniref:DUF983 domain-containing protein n=1 Tax=Wenyingzhuangia sp. 2_MG-2023 TaxID=3062639 RepID=UPI0026E2F584|nr:DUF983 domain-containing protein [Wenyingzhuangia sp. 2_MG-2023]MDO6737681.1 DUF983 domain-containing protein [Wenyingzhuangia sp. 2_MG-2023]MDO6802520.1 DUF983 domain-containing protein [Wenyingzhuangia sp. 1_MG-2023]